MSETHTARRRGNIVAGKIIAHLQEKQPAPVVIGELKYVLNLNKSTLNRALQRLTEIEAVHVVVAPKSPDISHGAAWAAMNSRGERYPSDLCG